MPGTDSTGVEIAQHASKPSQLAIKFHFTWQKGSDSIERHWINDRPWIQLSPRTFVLLLVSCFIVGSQASNARSMGTIHMSEICKAAGFYLILAFTLACRGHSAMQDSPELMFVHLKHSFVDWTTAVGALSVTAMVHLSLQNPIIGALASFLTPIACVIIASFLLPVFTKSTELPQNASTLDMKANQTGILDVESQKFERSESSAVVDHTSANSPKWRSLDARILTMGLFITILDFIINDEITGWPKTCQVSSVITAIMLVLQAAVPHGREIEAKHLYIVTVALFAISNQLNFLGMFTLFNDGIHDNGDHSSPVKAALFFALFGMMIINHRATVKLQEEHDLFFLNGRVPFHNHLLINLDLQQIGPNCRWQLGNTQTIIVLLLSSISGGCGERWPLPINTTIASLVMFLLVVGFQFEPVRNTKEQTSSRHLFALCLSIVSATVAFVVSWCGFVEQWPRSQVLTWTASMTYFLSLARILRLERVSDIPVDSSSSVPLDTANDSNDKA